MGLTFTFGLRKRIQNHSNGLPGAIEKVKEVRVEILMIKLLQNFRVLNQAIILVKTVTLFLFISQLIIKFFFYGHCVIISEFYDVGCRP